MLSLQKWSWNTSHQTYLPVRGRKLAKEDWCINLKKTSMPNCCWNTLRWCKPTEYWQTLLYEPNQKIMKKRFIPCFLPQTAHSSDVVLQENVLIAPRELSHLPWLNSSLRPFSISCISPNSPQTKEWSMACDILRRGTRWLTLKSCVKKEDWNVKAMKEWLFCLSTRKMCCLNCMTCVRRRNWRRPIWKTATVAFSLQYTAHFLQQRRQYFKTYFRMICYLKRAQGIAWRTSRAIL